MIKRIFLSLLMLFTAATIVNAEDALDGVMKLLEEEFEIVVITASKLAQSASSAPATIYVVTEDMIASRGYGNLQELLEDIPEVEFQKKSVTEYSNYATIRGMAGNENFIILLDGFRINSPTGTPNVIGANYSLANVRQVEVILGPASALYGADAFTGIINIITKSGAEVDGGRLRGSFGRFGTTENSFAIGRKMGKATLALSGGLYHSDEPFSPDFYPKEYAWYTNQYKKYGTVIVSPFVSDTITASSTPEPYETPTDAFFVSARLNTDNFEFGYSLNSDAHNSSVGAKPEYNIYAKKAVFETRIESLYGKHTLTSDDKKWLLQTSIWKGRYELTPRSLFLNTFTAFQPGFKYEVGRNIKFEEQITHQLNSRTTIIGGFTYEDITSLPKTGDLPFKFDPNDAPDLQGLYYIGTNITDQNGDTLLVLQDFYHVQAQNYGFYSQLQTNLKSAVQITLGARFDYNTRYGETFNPRLGLVYVPTRRLTAKVLYGQSFLAPSPYEAYQHYGAFIPRREQGRITGLFGPFWHLPNPDLKPERLRSIEGSVQYYLTDNSQIGLDIYHTQIEDLITVAEEFDTSFKGVPVDFAERPVNRGQATAFGGTARLTTLFKTGSATIKVSAAYSFSDGDIDNEQLTYSAKHTLKAGLEATIGRLSLAPRLLYRSRSYQQLYHREKSDIYSSDPYTVINLFARYRDVVKNERLTADIFLKISNLADARYYNASLATEEGFVETPQDPFRISGGVTIDFK